MCNCNEEQFWFSCFLDLFRCTPAPPHSPASDGCPPIWCLLGAGSLNALECSMTSALAAQRPHTHTEAKWLIVLAREERTRRRRRWGTQGEAHQPGISRTWVSMSTEWLMILLSKQLWERLHIVRTAISHALLALDCRLIEPHRRRIVTRGRGGRVKMPIFRRGGILQKMKVDKNGFWWYRTFHVNKVKFF